MPPPFLQSLSPPPLRTDDNGVEVGGHEVLPVALLEALVARLGVQHAGIARAAVVFRKGVAALGLPQQEGRAHGQRREAEQGKDHALRAWKEGERGSCVEKKKRPV